MPIGFGKRLARFSQARENDCDVIVPLGEGDASPDADYLGAGAPFDEAETSLAGLRSKMDRILQKEDARRERRQCNLDRALSELPFVLEETEHGRSLRRHRAVPAWELAGRVPIHGYTSARHAIFAPLALDESLASCDFSRALFLDTETTGLAGGTGTVPFLLGLAYLEGGSVFVEQLFLPNFGEEGPILRHLQKRLDAAEVIVSFNGKSFDWPLLRTRFVMNRLAPPKELPHCDLLHVARRIHKERLPDMRLQTIEREVLGLEREGDIESALIASIFGHFLRTGDGEGIRRVVTHNEQDVLSMVALAAVYGSVNWDGTHEGDDRAESASILEATDFIGIANTLRRARRLDEAEAMVTRVIEETPSASAHRTRAVIAKAKKNPSLAAADYHASLKTERSAKTHLELAKLYEHKLKDPQQALQWTLAGTGEDDAGLIRREDRLRKKLDRG